MEGGGGGGIRVRPIASPSPSVAAARRLDGHAVLGVGWAGDAAAAAAAGEAAVLVVRLLQQVLLVLRLLLLLVQLVLRRADLRTGSVVRVRQRLQLDWWLQRGELYQRQRPLRL